MKGTDIKTWISKQHRIKITGIRFDFHMGYSGRPQQTFPVFNAVV